MVLHSYISLLENSFKKRKDKFVVSFFLVALCFGTVGSILYEEQEALAQTCALEPAMEIIEEPRLFPYSDTINVLVDGETRIRVGQMVDGYEEEIVMLAKVVYREAGGIKEISHQAAVIWCVLNRVDGEFGDSLKAVITYPGAFAWRENTPVEERFVALAEDVIIRWLLEKEGYEDVGRTLPSDYYFFGGDGKYNYFRKEYRCAERWDWSLPTPYES